jgi:hypothetical protein
MEEGGVVIQAHREHVALISLFIFFENRESRLKLRL